MTFKNQLQELAPTGKADLSSLAASTADLFNKRRELHNVKMTSSIVTARLPANTVEGLSFIAEFSRNGDDSRGRLAAIETMHQRIVLLLEAGDPGPRLRELAAHAALLSDMAARYTVQALESSGARNAAIWQRLALQCQAAYTRTLIAIEGLKAQAKGTARVSQADDDDARDDDSGNAA